MSKMKIAIVTTYPPSKGGLNEYAYHFIRSLRKKSEVSELILLLDELSQGEHYQAEQLEAEPGTPVRIVPCWCFGSYYNPLRILSAIRKHEPDVVLFNLQFNTFGKSKASAALGLLTPPLIRAMGFPTVVLMHNLMDTVNLKGAGFGSRLEVLIRFVGTLITYLLLTVDLMAVTIPKYVELLEKKYGAKNVILAPHGAFEHLPMPAYEESCDPQVVMTFGKFGTYKQIEPLIEAFKLLQTEDRSTLELVIAGTDSLNALGYLKNVKKRYDTVPHLRFTGYVPEEEVPHIFRRATVVAFPYITTTGSSGVLHQAGEYGKAVVLPHIGDFADVIADEGYTGKFFEPGNVLSLAKAIAELLDDPQERSAIGQQNYLAAHGLPISEVVDWYLVHFQCLLDNKLQSIRRKQNGYAGIPGRYYRNYEVDRTL